MNYLIKCIIKYYYIILKIKYNNILQINLNYKSLFLILNIL